MITSGIILIFTYFLVGGFKHFLFSIIYGIILPIDQYFSRWLKPPTSFATSPSIFSNKNSPFSTNCLMDDFSFTAKKNEQPPELPPPFTPQDAQHLQRLVFISQVLLYGGHVLLLTGAALPFGATALLSLSAGELVPSKSDWVMQDCYSQWIFFPGTTIVFTPTFHRIRKPIL